MIQTAPADRITARCGGNKGDEKPIEGNRHMGSGLSFRRFF